MEQLGNEFKMKHKYYVLKYEDGSLVGIDQSSGGYPWKAWTKDGQGGSLHGVAMWPYTEDGKKKALEYSGVVRQFDLAVLEFQIVDQFDLAVIEF